MSTASAPVEIGRVALVVNDLACVARFYETALGLRRLSSDGTAVVLGAGDRVLLELRGDKAARRAGPREAGLFHTAFLLPSRADLGAWVRHAVDARVPVQGASDHLVSEAIYLADPEGNGIEIYADRPRLAWHAADGSLKMGTEPLDVPDLAASARAAWAGAPEGTVVGHVHLQVGRVDAAEEFWTKTIGMQVMAHYPGAAFLSSGGYHHHIGANVWNSRNAAVRNLPATGLAELELLAAPAEFAAMTARAGERPTDPWGTTVALTRKAA
ncbi:MAG: VOC family protein [Exiguobacterium profundum]|nr:MAG: VOC family protein [Exiguobacterium profundum]